MMAVEEILLVVAGGGEIAATARRRRGRVELLLLYPRISTVTSPAANRGIRGLLRRCVGAKWADVPARGERRADEVAGVRVVVVVLVVEEEEGGAPDVRMKREGLW